MTKKRGKGGERRNEEQDVVGSALSLYVCKVVVHRLDEHRVLRVVRRESTNRTDNQPGKPHHLRSDSPGSFE